MKNPRRKAGIVIALLYLTQDGLDLANRIQRRRTIAHASRKYTKIPIRSKNSISMPENDGVGVRPMKIATKGALKK
jgi:hypothetical protein